MVRPSTEKSRHARTVARWLPNPIDWTPIDRGLFLTAICLAVSASNVAFLSGLGYSEIADQLNPALYRPSIWIAVILTAATAMLFIVGLSARQRIDNWPLLSDLLAQGYTLGVIYFSYVTGLYTTQIAPLLVAGIALGIPLLHRRAVARSVVSGLFTLVAILVFDDLGIIPYGPLFTTPPVDALGRPVGALRYWQMTLLVMSPSLVWLVVNALLVRWREREALLRDVAITDDLTGLSNRRHFFEYFEAECLRAHRTGRSVGFVICDLDWFKQVNDNFGHRVGDLALQHVAAILRAEIRQGIDRVGRFGGEELVVLLPETDLEGTVNVAERMRSHLANTTISTIHGDLAVTASFGVSVRTGEAAEVDQMLEEADNMLYRAKHRGRNRVVWPESSKPVAASRS